MPLEAQGRDNFARGEEAFLNNDRATALPLLESALRSDPANMKAVQYLGLLYQQGKDYDKAIELYRRALPRAGSDTARISFNLANAYFAKGAASFAIEYYTKSMDADPLFAASWLNRGNAFLKTASYPEAVRDYRRYLELAPDNHQADTIRAIIALLEGEEAARERDKELARERAMEEEARRKQIMEDLAESLKEAASDTLGISAGSESVQQYDGEFELE